MHPVHKLGPMRDQPGSNGQPVSGPPATPVSGQPPYSSPVSGSPAGPAPGYDLAGPAPGYEPAGPAPGYEPVGLEPATLPPPPPPPPAGPGIPYPDQGGAQSPLPGPPGTYPYDPPYPYGAGQPYVPGQPWQSGYPPYYGAWQPRPTNGLAIASLVISIAALPLACLCYGIPGVLLGPTGAIMGHVSRRQIQQDGQQGDGLALAGMIIGWIVAGLSILGIAAVVATVVFSNEYSDVSTP